MQITVELPDDMARQTIPAGDDPARTALEDMAVEAYRAHRLREHELATLLGLGRYDLDGFLKRREVRLEYSIGDLRSESETHRKLGFRMRIVVSDTSPIRCLVPIGEMDLLENRYRRILIPDAVCVELQAQQTPDAVRSWMRSHPAWVEILPASQPGVSNPVSRNLHPGESNHRTGSGDSSRPDPDGRPRRRRGGVQAWDRRNRNDRSFGASGAAGARESGRVPCKAASRQLPHSTGAHPADSPG
jgi:hypothetical protein